VIDLDKLRSEFFAKYGTEPRIFRAPGRVNLIGEHTDYNDGFVLPCAIDFATYVAGSPRADRRIRVASMNFEHELEFDLDEPLQQTEKTWAKYVQGVGMILERLGYKIRGADLLIDSDVPVGAGLSSSAALETSTAFALSTLSDHKIDGMELAKIGQTAEHEFAGVRSGIMDQFVSVFGQADHALFLDCRSLEWSPVPVGDAQFIICNTKAKHDLAESEYNKRRAECEEAASFLGHLSLRDVSLEEFETKSAGMPATLRKRARHVITENARVLKAVSALSDGDLGKFGELLNESHESLRVDFEVSSDELDLMVNLARDQKGVLGARMTGGGFGGCTINLVEPGDHRDFVEKMSDGYHRETGIVPDIYKCDIASGVCELEQTDSVDEFR
jgi:galactokinase